MPRIRSERPASDLKFPEFAPGATLPAHKAPALTGAGKDSDSTD